MFRSAKVTPLAVDFDNKGEIEEIPLGKVIKTRVRRNAYTNFAWEDNCNTIQFNYREKKKYYKFAAIVACEWIYRGNCCCYKPGCGLSRTIPGRCDRVCDEGMKVFYEWFSMPEYQDIAVEALNAVISHRESMPKEPKRSLFGLK